MTYNPTFYPGRFTYVFNKKRFTVPCAFLTGFLTAKGTSNVSSTGGLEKNVPTSPSPTSSSVK